MASGVPVVAPAVGGPLDLVRPGVTGLLYEPDDTDDLRRRVGELVADPGLRAQYGANARETVLSRSWASVCGELLGHYDTALAHHRRLEDAVS
jgi:phosphatidylinositol alpha 1,6-mannosyltransferase